MSNTPIDAAQLLEPPAVRPTGLARPGVTRRLAKRGWQLLITSPLVPAIACLGFLLYKNLEGADTETAVDYAIPVALLWTGLSWFARGQAARSALDTLTSPADPQGFEARLAAASARAFGAGAPLALLVVDVDYLKQINQLRGHATGDLALRRLGQALLACCSSTGLEPERYGGDEFVILAPGWDCSRAGGLAHRILDAVRRPTDGPLLTVSIGVADLATAGPTPGALLEAATQALRLAKTGGRDRMVTAVRTRADPSPQRERAEAS